ncbi:MAG: hypothetical protein LBL21_03645 [Rickettsiales bacterium]|jgi:hypothetical protein|nr:hypothetical protein [Rickettsiales bacterium]
MKIIRKYVLITAAIFMMASAPDLSAAKVCTEIAGTVEAIYPVGAVYISTNNADPATLFGFGMWERFGQGRALVGVDESDPEFDTVEKTGGEKAHKLTIAEMPSHNHGIYTSGNDSGGSYNDVGKYHDQTNGTSYTGGGGAHNNLQPYITVYIWRRVS